MEIFIYLMVILKDNVMTNLKRAKVVMLPTNEKAKGIAINYKCDPIGYGNLYILSDEEIKEGDWYILHSIAPILKKASKNINDDAGIRSKIIATTDTNLNLNNSYIGSIGYLGLPQPSPSFIQKYIEAYNQGKPITEVMVEYDDFISNNNVNLNDGYHRGIKVNQKDNTITIKRVKDSWNESEIGTIATRLLNDYILHLAENGATNLGSADKFVLKHWLNNNLT